MDVCVHNFLVTLRSIDNRWEKFMTPTKLNNMNKGVSVPVFDLKSIYGSCIMMISQACTSISLIPQAVILMDNLISKCLILGLFF